MFNILDLADPKIFEEYSKNLSYPEITQLAQKLCIALFEEVEQGNYVNFRKAFLVDKNTMKFEFDWFYHVFSPSNRDTFYRNLATALLDASVTIDIGNNSMAHALNFVRYLRGKKVKVEFHGKLTEDDAANFARNLQGTNVTDVQMGWDSINDNGLFQFVQNLQNTKVNSLNFFGLITAEGLLRIIELIPRTNLTTITQTGVVMTFISENPPALNQALAENKQRLVNLCKTALAAAMIAHENLAPPSDKVDYPRGEEQSEKGTAYARGIISQLKNNEDGTPNPIMQNILSFLPNMDEEKATQAIVLAAKRHRLEEKKATKEEGYEPQEDNPLKRINPSHNNPSKRARTSQREIAALEINTNEVNDLPRLRKHKKR